MFVPDPAIHRHLVVVRWSDRDPWRVATRLAVAVIGFAMGFAVFGVPHVPLMWPLYRLGVVLPSCGLTRGVVAIVRGDLARGWAFNPASPLAVLAAGLLLVRFVIGQRSGRWLVVRVPASKASVVLAMAMIVALWVNQQRHAELLIHHLR